MDKKFRAWSGDLGCYTKMFSIHASGKVSTLMNAHIDKDSGLAIADPHWDEEDVIVEQYVGLKDKNGIEIYEGDIVKPVDYHRHIVVTIGFQEHEENFGDIFGFYGCNLPTKTGYGEILDCEYEIIGNIHKTGKE